MHLRLAQGLQHLLAAFAFLGERPLPRRPERVFRPILFGRIARGKIGVDLLLLHLAQIVGVDVSLLLLQADVVAAQVLHDRALVAVHRLPQGRPPFIVAVI